VHIRTGLFISNRLRTNLAKENKLMCCGQQIARHGRGTTASTLPRTESNSYCTRRERGDLTAFGVYGNPQGCSWASAATAAACERLRSHLPTGCKREGQVMLTGWVAPPLAGKSTSGREESLSAWGGGRKVWRRRTNSRRFEFVGAVSQGARAVERRGRRWPELKVARLGMDLGI
jgi:hypothetical protein